MAQDDPLYVQLAERIEGLVASGSLKRGDRIPSVREMSRQQGVSASTVQLAYRRLEDRRLIEARPKSGYFVAAAARALPEPAISEPPPESLPVDLGALWETVMAAAADPSYVSFGAACPDGALFQLERVRRTVARAALHQRAALGRYPLGPGSESLRQAIARRALALGCQLDPRRILITNGCTESISLCLRAVTRPGDVVALESPTYFGFLQLLQGLGLRALEIPTHPRHGISLEALRFALDTHAVKAVMAMPTLSNSLGATMPTADKRRLVELLSERDVPLIEDVLYNDLYGNDERRRAAKAWDRNGQVMICSSYSKTLAPGLRLGWVEAGRWQREVTRLKHLTSGGQIALVELAMADLLSQPSHEASLRRLQQALATRMARARELIAASFPAGTRVTDPPAGFILWVEFPPGVDTVALFQACLKRRISIAPGPMFTATPRYRHCVRLSVGGPWTPEVEDALREIGRIAAEMLRRRRADDAARGDGRATPEELTPSA